MNKKVVLGIVLGAFMQVSFAHAHDACAMDHSKGKMKNVECALTTAVTTIAALATESGSVVNGVRVIDITAVRYKFTPDKIQVKKGEKIKLNVLNKEGDHGLRIKDFKVVNTEKKNMDSYEFVADKTGSFHLHCGNYCGKGHGEMFMMMNVVN